MICEAFASTSPLAETTAVAFKKSRRDVLFFWRGLFMGQPFFNGGFGTIYERQTSDTDCIIPAGKYNKPGL